MDQIDLSESAAIAEAIAASTTDHGWQKVTYPKRQRKTTSTTKQSDLSNGTLANGGDSKAKNVFRSLEQQSEDRRRRIKKVKKEKKPKITVAEAASKIDSANLAVFLDEISGSYEEKQDIEMMRFADYFGRAFSSVSSAQFPWVKMFRESPLAKIVDVPISNISDDVYKTSVDWINKHSVEAISSFILWSLDSILLDFASQQPVTKGSKKTAQQPTSKSQVAIFVVLAMVLRRKPDGLIAVLPTLRETPKYQGQDKLPVIVWMMAQAAQGDLAVGLYAWAHNLLPTLSSRSCNPQILSSPKAKTILVNGAVRKGERLVPPASLEVLLRVTFPAPSARVKATERFAVVYPILKEVGLGGSRGSKAMKPVAQQMLKFAIKAAGESNSDLSKEAAGIFIWCLSQNADCYKQWENLYVENMEASVAILKKLSEDWKQQSARLLPLDHLRETLKSFRQTTILLFDMGKLFAFTTSHVFGGVEYVLLNAEVLEDGENQAVVKNADKYCKLILGRLSRGSGCLKGMAIFVGAVAVGAFIVSPKIDSLDWEKLTVAITNQLSLLKMEA
ncbi:hypothetical protein ACFE04_029531 [Oxalis oulophora]